MNTSEENSATSRRTGWVISGLVILFLLFDGIGKAVRQGDSVEGTIELGYPDDLVRWIGVTLLVCTVVYAIPRTAAFGAILLTGFLGGAMATQVRVEDWWFLFPAAMTVLVWLGLYLRDARVRALLA